MAVWEKEGWGTTNDCLQMVVDNYKTQGTTDRRSVNALESYLRRLTPPAFKVMFEHSRTTTAQMIADVLGVDKLLDVYNVFMQEPGNTENARELRQRIEKLEQQKSKNNAAGIVGIITTKPRVVMDAPTWAQKVYEAVLEYRRPSGTKDKFFVQFPGQAAGTKKALLNIKKGKEVLIGGEVRTQNMDNPEPHEPRVKICIYAKVIAVNDPPADPQNEVKLCGHICKDPRVATARFGKIAVTSFIVAVNSHHGADYIPCVCWRNVAEAAAKLKVGAYVEITGRMQSREYKKKMPDGKPPYLATTHEVSVTQLGFAEDTDEQKTEGSEKTC